MSITVKEAMKIGAFTQCKIIAGEAGLHNKISSVDTMEIPNISPWLRKNLLLVTTGYSIKDNPGALSHLVRDLAKTESAGLALKTRFLGKVPKEVIDLANDLNIPIIEIPAEIPFVDILNPIMKAIGDIQNSKLELSNMLHSQFLELELNGGGLPEIAKMLQRIIGNPIIITDGEGYILEQYWGRWNANDFKNIFSDCKAYERLASKLLPPKGEIEATNTVQTADGEVYVSLRGALKKNKICGYVTVIEASQRLDEVSRVAIDHAATTVSLEFLKMEVLIEQTRHMNNSLFIDLLSERVGEEEGLYRAQMLKWPSMPFNIAVFDIDDFREYTETRKEEDIMTIKQEMKEVISNLLQQKGYKKVAVSISDSLVCLISCGEQKWKKLYRDLVNIQQKVVNVIGLSITVGISWNVQSILDIRSHYEEAIDAITIARKQKNNLKVADINQLRLEHAILKSCNNRLFKQYIHDNIIKLEKYDRINKTDLLNTLIVLVNNLGSRTKTSKELFLHRNTLPYRIKRIEQITGLDLSDSKCIINLAILIKIRDYINE